MKMRATCISLICLLMIGAGATVVDAGDSMADFGLDARQLEERIVDSLVKAHIPAYPDKKRFKSVPPALRAAFVRNTLAWLKTYTESDAFKNDYARQRASAKPSAPETVDADDMIADYQAKQRRNLKKMKQDIARMPPETQKAMLAMLAQMESEINQSAQNEQVAEMMKQQYVQENASRQQEYQAQVARWEKKYPENPDTLVATRLRQFLEVSRDVAYEADLVPDERTRLLKFADARYEAQSKMWKLCYRAGREPVQAARAFVSQWLNQIEAP